VITLRRARGDAHEAAARTFLERAGLRVLATNVQCRHGEIDLVLRDGEVLVFCEVRYRADDGHGGAAASVDLRKQARLAAAARWFLAGQPGFANDPCRFDVVAVDGDGPPRWIKDAFRLTD
jgi:putative endonuclease